MAAVSVKRSNGGSFSVLRMIQSPNGVMQIVEETLNNTHITKQWLLFPQHYETCFDSNLFLLQLVKQFYAKKAWNVTRKDEHVSYQTN